MTTKVPIELSSTPSIVDGGNATAITIDSSENSTFAGTINCKNTFSITDDTTSAFLQTGSSLVQFGGSTDAPLIFYTNNAEKMRIDSSGHVGIGTTSPYDSDWTAASTQLAISGTNYGVLHLIDEGGPTKFSMGSGDGKFYMAYDDVNAAHRLIILSTGVMQSPPTYAQTTSNSANMVVRSSGDFERSTSSERYKNSITDATKGLAELKTLRPVNYKGNNDGDTVFYGLIAEEVHNADLTEFVEYDDQNRPDALRYPHMVSLCIKAIQEQQVIIDDLKSRLKTLEDA